MPDHAAKLLAAIPGSTPQGGVIGPRYLRLPLARAFAANRFPTLGFDVDPAKVAALKKGESYIGHISPASIQEMFARGFEPTDQFDRLGEPDAVVVCVPTPLTEAREPDLTY